MTADFDAAAAQFVDWLDEQVTDAARGTGVDTLEVAPSGSYWLGRLAPQEAVLNRGLGERGERLDPCAMGVRLLTANAPPWSVDVVVKARVWRRPAKDQWVKSSQITARVTVELGSAAASAHEHGADVLTDAIAAASGVTGFSALVRTEVRTTSQGVELTILLVNTSPEKDEVLHDTNLYEAELEVSGVTTTPFLLEALPDSFRYDRRVAAYGVNCGVAVSGGGVRTTDTVVATRRRPTYLREGSQIDLRFATLMAEPLGQLQRLVDDVKAWGRDAWSSTTLDYRQAQEAWSAHMRAQADVGAEEFAEEMRRVERGVALLDGDAQLLSAFRMMNEAMVHAAAGRYDGWRPFQIGFMLANLACLVDPDESDTADVLWFATGGGKTETYLGLIVMSALLDRLQGKSAGMSAWSRFPLRMLSLQQTQRFADALAGAEIVRDRHELGGQRFSVGFFVGQGGTPNRVDPEPAHKGQPDPYDDNMPNQFKVLTTCPFCHTDAIWMDFDHLTWSLHHRCSNPECSEVDRPLPFHVVDDEIYRFLPTVVVGTLDKAALISSQASMRGFVGPPHGVCSEAGHGFSYAPRSKRPNGCLVPGCPGSRRRLPQAPASFAPRFRLQDELHLLRDSLGAVDSHYEGLLDGLQSELTARRAKILASSATLSGYERQVDVLYRRRARVFPTPGPLAGASFWTQESPSIARRFVAIAPRGQTLEFVIDKMLAELQNQVRRLRDTPEAVCAAAGIDPVHASKLLDMYGTDVVYGNTLRDLDAAMRSSETQIETDGPLNTASLTGRTPFDEVRTTLQRLQAPEADHADRLHVVGASSMMSHGVDIDRLNVMVMLGLPLTTAEFIQTTARVGRRYPGLVYVVTKIARERDAGLYRAFPSFVAQGDRFVESIPITHRSRRVLERTLPGLELARVLAVHEPESRRSLATVNTLREYVMDSGIDASTELAAIVEALHLTEEDHETMVGDARLWLDQFFENLVNPTGDMRFPSECCPDDRGPMRSLRDVEEQAPITGYMT